MGDSLNERTLQAFASHVEHLEKMANIASTLTKGMQRARQFGRFIKKAPRSIGSDIADTARRAVPTKENFRTGWNELRGLRPGEQIPEALRFTKGEGNVSRTAKRLGMSGWTGKGAKTKYLPIGEKALTVGGSALAVPDIISAANKDVGPTGSGGVWEKGLGEAAGLSGAILGGRRLIPSIALYALGNKGGSSVGRVLDRLRSGADIGTAIQAPTREEAIQQLANIERYHG